MKRTLTVVICSYRTNKQSKKLRVQCNLKMDFLLFASLRYSIRLSIKILSSHRIFQERCPINNNKKLSPGGNSRTHVHAKDPRSVFCSKHLVGLVLQFFYCCLKVFFLVFLSHGEATQQRKEINTPRKIVQDTLQSFLYQGVVSFARLFLFKAFLLRFLEIYAHSKINNKKTDALDCETSSIPTSFVTFDRTNKYPSIPGDDGKGQTKRSWEIFSIFLIFYRCESRNGEK